MPFLKKNVETIEPDIEIFSQGYTLNSCIRGGYLKQEEERNYLKFREAKNRHQADLVAAFDKNYIEKISYIDQSLLKRRLAFESLMQLKIVDGTLKIKMDHITPDVLAKECAETKKLLDQYADAPDAAADKPVGQAVTVQIPADVVENDKIYKAQLAKLTPQQAGDIEKVVRYGATVHKPFIDMLVGGFQVEGFCVPRKLMDESYLEKFQKVQDHVLEKTGAAIKKYNADVISKVTSMDKEVVSRQIMGNNIIENRRVTESYKLFGANLPAMKVENDCASLKSYIDTYGAKHKLF